jgi:hypothetical protein
MQTKLLGKFAVVLNNVGIGLHLGGSKLSPELDNLLGSGLDKCNTSVIFFVDSAELRVQCSDIVRREVEAGRNSRPRCSGRQFNGKERGLEV